MVSPFVASLCGGNGLYVWGRGTTVWLREIDRRRNGGGEGLQVADFIEDKTRRERADGECNCYRGAV